MTEIETLGLQVRNDRERKGLTQANLAELLQKSDTRPLNPHTKRRHNFARSWVAKLECNSLKRELQKEVRQYLAKILDGDTSLYLALPTKITSQTSRHDQDNILPLIKFVASKEGLTSFSFDQFRRLCDAENACKETGISLVNPLGTEK